MPARRANSDELQLINSPHVDPARRRALKAGIGVGAAALVWTEPTIKGLVRRPAYAGAGSQELSFDTGILTGDNDISTLSAAGGDVTFQVIEGFSDMQVVANAAGCTCEITGSGGTFTLKNGIEPDLTGGTISGGSIQWTGVISAIGTVTIAGDGTNGISGVCTPLPG